MKAKTQYECGKCGATQPKWSGQCGSCGAWNSLVQALVVEQRSTAGAANRHATWAGATQPVRDLSNVATASEPRLNTGLAEFDRVLGGGLVRGGVHLVGGDPGIGKSTLLLQVAASLGRSLRVLYVTGEESTAQIALRAGRLGLAQARVRLAAETDILKVQAMLEDEQPEVVIMDSIQTAYHPELSSAPGSVSQVKECAALLTRYAKTTGCALFLVGHVTKEGTLAGPKTVSHMVDVELYFEGEPGTPFRMLRANKNRFGAVNEMGIFSMGGQGLEEVPNPSSLFLTHHEKPVPGCAVLAAMEGNRPLFVEVQALVEESQTANPKRFSAGLDTNRLQMLLAVLAKHGGISASAQNVYLKVVGGVRLTEPAADLPAFLASYSSLRDKPLPDRLVSFGEVGLAGELRPVQDVATRLREAAKLGFTRAIMPRTKEEYSTAGIEVAEFARIEDVLDALRSLRKAA